MTALRTAGRTVLVVDALALIGCGVLAVASVMDTSSSTSAIGIAVALVLAVPLLISLVLTGLGLRAHRRSPDSGTKRVMLGAALTVGLVTLVSLQLALGS